MSADNGIYILITPGRYGLREFRVAHLQAIDNLSWDDEKGDYTDDPDILIKNARRMFKDCTVYPLESAAVLVAWDMAKDIAVLEYGLSRIEIDREF